MASGSGSTAVIKGDKVSITGLIERLTKFEHITATSVGSDVISSRYVGVTGTLSVNGVGASWQSKTINGTTIKYLGGAT